MAKKHELNVHYPEISKKYACKECDATFHDRSKLRLHSLKHSKIKPYVCEQCGKGFNWIASFQVGDKQCTIGNNEKQVKFSYLILFLHYRTTWICTTELRSTPVTSVRRSLTRGTLLTTINVSIQVEY